MSPGDDRPAAGARCALCGRTDARRTQRLADPLGGPRPFHLIACASCGLVRLEPQLAGEALAAYYPDDYWEPVGSGARGFAALAQQQFIEWRIAAGLTPLGRRIPAGARVLDVGCGSGALLRVLLQAGFAAHGVEMSPAAAAQAARTGAEVHCGTLQQACYADGSFDAVTAIHVLEHLPDPLETLREIHRILRPGGWLLVEVPNIGSLAHRLFGARWQSLSVPHHLYHFAPSTLTAAAHQAGFEVRRVGQYSARASAAGWAVTVAPSLDPVHLRRREAAGRRTLARKLAYLCLQLAFTPLALGSAWLKRGDVVVMLAQKPARSHRGPA